MAVADCGKIPLQTSWIEIRNTSELNSFFRGLCSITFPAVSADYYPNRLNSFCVILLTSKQTTYLLPTYLPTEMTDCLPACLRA